MPFINLGTEFEKFGFRKIWSTGKDSKISEAYNYNDFMSNKYAGLELESIPLVLQILNVIMVIFVFS